MPKEKSQNVSIPAQKPKEMSLKERGDKIAQEMCNNLNRNVLKDQQKKEIESMSKPVKSLDERLKEAGAKIGSQRGGRILPQRRTSPVPQEWLDQVQKEMDNHRSETHGSPITPTKKTPKS